jgi:SAM-dependent methyltransferase
VRLLAKLNEWLSSGGSPPEAPAVARQNREWRGMAIPPAELVPCGRLTDTAEKFHAMACADADRLAREVGLKASSVILDIGCGAGRLAIGLSARKLPFASYLGVDVAKSRIDWCVANLTPQRRRLRLTRPHRRMRFQLIDMPNERYNPAGRGGLDLDVQPSTVDIVNLYSVFSHMREADIRAYLRLIERVLRPGGVCFLTMYTASDVPPVTENPTDFGPLQWNGPLHCMRYDLLHWRQMVEEAGLMIVRQMPDINPDAQTAYYLAKPLARPAVRPARRDAPKLVVGFFGVNRSLRWTHRGIQQCIYDPIEAFGCQVTRVAHFNRPELIHSPRSGEFNVPLARGSLERLKLDLCSEEPQSEDNIAGVLPVVLRTPAMFVPDSDGTMRRNALQQLYSLKRLGELIGSHGGAFDVYGLFRADLMYLSPAPVQEIVDLIVRQGVDIVTPDWHRWGGYNDRLAFCSRRGAEVYLNRIERVPEFCASTGAFQSEALLRHVAERSGLRHVEIAMLQGRRVRATGVVVDENFAA